MKFTSPIQLFSFIPPPSSLVLPLRPNELLGGVAPGLRLRLGRHPRGRPRADPLPQRNDFAKVICVMYRHTVQFV